MGGKWTYVLENELGVFYLKLSHTVRTLCLRAVPQPLQVLPSLSHTYLSEWWFHIMYSTHTLRYKVLTCFLSPWQHQQDGKRTYIVLQFLWRWSLQWSRKLDVRMGGGVTSKTAPTHWLPLASCPKGSMTLPSIPPFPHQVQAHEPIRDVLQSSRHCKRKM